MVFISIPELIGKTMQGRDANLPERRERRIPELLLLFFFNEVKSVCLDRTMSAFVPTTTQAHLAQRFRAACGAYYVVTILGSVRPMGVVDRGGAAGARPPRGAPLTTR